MCIRVGRTDRNGAGEGKSEREGQPKQSKQKCRQKVRKKVIWRWRLVSMSVWYCCIYNCAPVSTICVRHVGLAVYVRVCRTAPLTWDPLLSHASLPTAASASRSFADAVWFRQGVRGGREPGMLRSFGRGQVRGSNCVWPTGPRGGHHISPIVCCWLSGFMVPFIGSAWKCYDWESDLPSLEVGKWVAVLVALDSRTTALGKSKISCSLSIFCFTHLIKNCSQITNTKCQ